MARPDRPRTPPGLPLQDVGFLTEMADMAPMLARRLAEVLEKEGADPREVFKRTGWLRSSDPSRQWLYEHGDQPFRQTSGPIGRSAGFSQPARVKVNPASPLLTGDPLTYTTRGGETVQRPVAAGNKPEPQLRLRRDQPHPKQLDFEYDLPTRGQGRYAFQDAAFNTEASSVPRADPRFRPPTAGELFQHPMMFGDAPHLAEIPIEAQYGDVRGKYTPGGQDVTKQGPPMPVLQATGANPANVLDPMGPDTTMQSVALHELGHGQQETYKLPRGGNPNEFGIGGLGLEVIKRAKAGEGRIQALRRLLGEEMVASDVPGYQRWTDYGQGKAFPAPDQMGYQSLWGEAMARLMEKRAKLDPRAQGDIHPFESLDIPPDLMFAVPQHAAGKVPFAKQGAFPPQGEFDWLFFKPGAKLPGR